MSQEKILHLLVAFGVAGILCSIQQARAEEAVTSIPLEIPLPENVSVAASLPELPFSLNEEMAPSFAEAFSEEALWPPSILPPGREVVLASLQSKFSVGKRADGLIYHPASTFTLHTEKGLHHFLEGERGRRGNSRFLTEEEKIALGFEFAESVTESVQALAIPFLGDFLAGCLEMGRDVDDATREMRRNCPFRFTYTEKTFRAAYKESF